MAYLPEANLSEKIYLPSTDTLPEEQKAWVILKDKLTFGELESVESAIGEFNKRASGLTELIADWNYESRETGAKLDINLENVRKLNAADVTMLVDKLLQIVGNTKTPLSDDQKKTSPGILTPHETPTDRVTPEQ